MKNTHGIGSTTSSLIAVTALALTLSVAGCKSSTPAAPPADDASLTQAVQNRLSGDSALSTESIQTSVQNGVVTLNGNVSNEAARSLAAADASQIAGIKTVVNNLLVQPPAPVADAAPPPMPAPEPAPAPKKAAPKPAAKPAPIERQEAAPQAPPPAPAPAPAPVAAAPAPPPPPAFKTVTIPSGTTIPVRITQTLDSASTQQGQSFSGTVATDVMADGLVAIRQGTAVTGRVTAVQEAAHYKGSSLLTVELVSIDRHGDSLAVTTQPYSVQGKGRGKNTAAKVGGGAAIGAIIGAIAGGGKGAAIGSAAGAGLGAGANTVTRGEQVQIPSESLVNFQITNTLAVRVSTSNTLSTGSNSSGQRRPMNPSPDQPQ
ncbi:BON domain-containing protein [Edaphobacter aggregans]|uniref:BON domain-containing protein n=1 Tax=Edaphobacter aggregans TaxID=570835 RepID=UPI000690218B|nr:BON domain-containing protein [Edaphobacter aggregans]